MSSKVENAVRADYMNAVRELFEGRGEDVLQVKSGTISIPWVKDDDEGYLNITFSIPKGERQKDAKTGVSYYVPYDGFAESENYKMENEAKAAKKAEAAAKKAAKIEHDKAAREEVKRKREERNKTIEEGDA